MPDPFIGGRMRGVLRPEDDLAVCLLANTDNGFNNLLRLEMLWTVAHRWTAALRFAFNCYIHFLQLLIRVLGY